MVFSSYIFVFLFLPLVLIAYFATYRHRKVQNFVLVVASLYFYGYFNWNYLLIIMSSIIVNFTFGHCIKKSQDKGHNGVARTWLVLAVLFNIGLLGYFKYYDFFIENINVMFKTNFVLKNILLPLGISFFTFQQLSFVISIYKKEEKIESFLEYIIFVTFFPQLVAGPIVTYSEMMPQFINSENRRLNTDNLQKGIYIFVSGFFKKVVIADTLSIFANNGFTGESLSMATAWAATISYTLQIYFDFSGYSDMAVGLGKMFNIDLPVNFLSPYKSASIGEFWKRWHITLGRALKSYIYIPLGGNRKGKLRTYLNNMVTFLGSGLWHGASWNFVLWGGLNGFVIILEKIFDFLLKKVPRFIKVAVTFIVTNLLWVLFRAETFEDAMVMYNSLFDVKNFGFSGIGGIVQDGIMQIPSLLAILYFMVIIILLLYIVFFKKNTIEKAEGFVSNRYTVIITAVLMAISVVFLSRESAFIYFNF